jgi:hypothetical protein
MTDLPATVGALATIVAALVGGAVTFLVAVFTKENKVSGTTWRQNSTSWIRRTSLPGSSGEA